jgi:uncharacterized protein (UPF0332 family)
MNFERLLSNKKIEEVNKTDFNLDLIESGLKFAKKGIETENYNWAMSLIYESIIKMINGFMNFLGYRAIGKEHHKNAFEFLREINIKQSFVEYFDDIRVKRNNFIYRDIANTSKKEVEEIIEKANEFVQEIRTFVHKIETQK